MSLVTTKFYDSDEEVSLTVKLTEVEEEHTNMGFPHRASERGHIHMAYLGCTIYWWRVDGDIHLLANEEDNLKSTKASVRFPKDFISFQVSPGPNNVLVVVGVNARLEFTCVRLEVSKASSGVTLTAPFSTQRFPPHDEFLDLCGGSSVRSMAIVPSGNDPSVLAEVIVTNGFSVFRFELLANGSTNASQIAMFDGVERCKGSVPRLQAPCKVVVQSVVVVAGLVLLIEPRGSAIAYDVTDMSHKFRGTFPITGVVEATVARIHSPSVVRLAAACSDGSCAIVDLDTSAQTVSHQWTIDAPAEICRLSSLFLGEADCMVGWSDCDLSAVPTNLVSIFEGGAHANMKGTSMIAVSKDGQSTDLIRWSSTWAANDFFATSCNGCTVVLEGDDSARIGALLIHEATGLLGVVHDSPLYSASLQILSKLRLRSDSFTHTASRLTPLPPQHKHIAFVAGVSLLGQLKDSGIQHLQYLYERTLASPAQFGMFAEFHYLRANASNHGDVIDVSEEDALVALDYISLCEVDEPSVDVTTHYTTNALLQTLASRLLYLQCVYIGWMAGPSVGVPSRTSTITTRVSAMVEVTVAAILYVERGGVKGIRAVTEHVNTLTQHEMDDVIGLSNLGSDLIRGPDVASLRGGEAWASALRHRYPVVAHFVFEATLRENDKSAVAASEVLGMIGEVASSLATMVPSLAAVVLEKLLKPYNACTRPFWPQAVLDEIAYENSHIIVDTYGAAVLYRVLALRRIISPTNHSSLLDGAVIDTHFMPDVLLLQQQVQQLLQSNPEDASLADMDGFLHLLLIDAQLVMARCAIQTDDVPTAIQLLSAVLKSSNEMKSETVNSYLRDLVDHCLRKRLIVCLGCVVTSSPQIDSMIVAHLLHVATSPAPFTAPQREIVENGRFMAALALCEFLKARRAYGLIARLMYEIAALLRGGGGTTVNTPAYCTSLMAKAVSAVKAIPDVSPVVAIPETIPFDHPLLRHLESDGLERQDSTGRTPVSRLVSSVPNRAQVSTLRPMSRADIPLLSRRFMQCDCEGVLLSCGHGVLIEKWGHVGSAAESSFNTKLIRELVRAHEWKLAASLAYTCEQSVSSVLMSQASSLAATNAEPAYITRQWKVMGDSIETLPGSTRQYTFDSITASMGTCPMAVPESAKRALVEIDLGALLRSYLTCASSGAPSMLAGADELRTVVVGLSGLPDVVALEGLDLVARYLKATDNGDAFSRYNLPINAFVAYPVIERWAIVAGAVVNRSQGAEHPELVSIAKEVKKLVADRSATRNV